jgi:NAD(P)-dependent dehydrogenase (short-subunit alcohol dehydrogenase family)
MGDSYMKTALITGANKGIGFEVARQLGGKGFQVFVGARNPDNGREAVETLKKNGALATFVPLDVSDLKSIKDAVQAVSEVADHLDVLVNNAGILLSEDTSITQLSPETVIKTFQTNTLGPLLVTQAFLPLLSRSSAPRVVNVSSGGGQLSEGMDMWAPAYCLSKTALNAVTSLFAAAFPDIPINSVCPGWVRTDMGGANATRSVEQGADTIVWLAADAPQEITGQFLRDRKQIPW